MILKYNSIKNRAQKRGLNFTLSYEQFSSLKLGDCHYCGTHSLFLKHYCVAMSLKTPWMTIDRKDNALGYTPENVVSACFICNRIKSNFFIYEEMLEIGQKYVKPRMLIFEQEAMDGFEEECKNDSDLYYYDDLFIEDVGE